MSLPRLAVILAAVLLVVGCGRVREIQGTARGIGVDQMQWLERTVAADLGDLDGFGGRTVKRGPIIVRADGQVISARPLLDAMVEALKGIGAVVVEDDGEAECVIGGTINVQSEEEADGRTARSRYVVRLRLVGAGRAEVWAQSYEIVNRTEQARWK